MKAETDKKGAYEVQREKEKVQREKGSCGKEGGSCVGWRSES